MMADEDAPDDGACVSSFGASEVNDIGLVRIAENQYIAATYNVNVDVTDNNLLETYQNIDSELRLQFTIAELMQNVMDWTLKHARVPYKDGDDLAYFTSNAASVLRLDVRGDMLQLVCGDKIIMAVCAVKPRNSFKTTLYVVQSGLHMLPYNAFVFGSSEKQGHKGPGGVPTGGGFGIGLKQLLQLCSFQGIGVDIGGTLPNSQYNTVQSRTRDGKATGGEVTPSAETDRPETLQGTVSVDSSFVNEAALACGGGLSMFIDKTRFLVHKLTVPNSSPEMLINLVQNSQVTLRHLNTPRAFEDLESKCLAFDQDCDSRIYVNGIFSGYGHSFMSRMARDSKRFADVLVVNPTLVKHTRGQVDVTSAYTPVLHAVLKQLEIRADSAQQAYEMVSNLDSPFATLLREESGAVGVSSQLKNLVAKSEAGAAVIARFKKTRPFNSEELGKLIDEFKRVGWPSVDRASLFKVPERQDAPVFNAFESWLTTAEYDEENIPLLTYSKDIQAEGNHVELLRTNVLSASVHTQTISSPAFMQLNKFCTVLGLRIRFSLWKRVPALEDSKSASGFNGMVINDDTLTNFTCDITYESGTLEHHVFINGPDGPYWHQIQSVFVTAVNTKATRLRGATLLDTTLQESDYAHLLFHYFRMRVANLGVFDAVPWDDAASDAILAATQVKLGAKTE